MIDLKPFCGTDIYRPYLHKPFSRGDWTYATNGHVIVRVPRIADIDGIDRPTIRVDEPFNAAGRKPDLIPINIDLPNHSGGECSYCDGRGYEHDCPDCGCECEYCSGTGDAQEEISVSIRGAIFNAKYIRLIQSLPNAKLAAIPSPDGPSWFSFDGGEGVLMPMLSPHKNHIADPEAETAP